MPSIFNFVEKEGKHFAPIVTEVPASYELDTGQDSSLPRFLGDDGQNYVGVGTTEKSGVKGVFAKIRFVSNSRNKAELFAINTEAFNSSN